MDSKYLLIGLGIGALIFAATRRAGAASLPSGLHRAPRKLSDHFDLLEFVRQFDPSYGLTDQQFANVSRLVSLILEPLRVEIGAPITITSGGRPPEWRDAAGRDIDTILREKGYAPSRTSDHKDFSGADLAFASPDLYDRALRVLLVNPHVRQVIAYYHTVDGRRVPTHIHVAVITPGKPKIAPPSFAFQNVDGQPAGRIA